MGVAWEAFKAHGGGHSLRATVKAAATATSLAVEHLRKRNRERLLMEKGGGAGKRLSGPVQITLEDLQVRCGARLFFWGTCEIWLVEWFVGCSLIGWLDDC